MKKLLALVLSAVMLLSAGSLLTSCSGDAAGKGLSDSPLAVSDVTVDYKVAEDFKIGFICLHDEKSTYDLNFINAAKAVQTAVGLSNEQVIIKTNIPEDVACYEAAADLVDQGCDLIFANSFGHESFILKAAKEFTDVQFCHATGTTAHTEGLSNFHNAFASIYEGRYLAGIAAGMKLNEMIKAGKFTADEAKIGYVGAFTYAEVISGYTSFYLGAKSVCPTVTMEVQFTGSWYDATEEKNAAEKLISSGCKLISQHADSMGAPSACESAGVPNVSYNGSTYDSCPGTFIVSSAINWAPYFNYIIKCVATGEDIKTDWCGGISEGSVVLTGINLDVAAEGTADAIKTAVEKFKAGTLHVFDTSSFTVNGQKLESYKADVDTDSAFTPDTEAISGGYFHESEYRSAPYFDVKIDGITLLNQEF